MINNGTIIVQIGTKQQLFKDRETYPKTLCDYIEDLVSCNSSEISDDGGIGRIRFNTGNGDLLVQLSIDSGNSKLSDESKAIVLIRLEESRIKSPVYYGVDCKIDFKSKSNVYSLDSIEDYIESLKKFYSSWVVSRGEISVVVLIIDDYMVFERIINDDFFKYSYILYSE